MEKKDKYQGDKALAVVISKLKVDGNPNFDPTTLLFLEPLGRLTEFKDDLNFHSIFDATTGLYVSSDLNYLYYFDGKHEMVGDTDNARKYGFIWDNFFKIGNDVFCLRYGLVTGGIDLLQLTKEGIPDFDNVDRGARLISGKPNLTQDFVLGGNNQAYISELGGLWRKLQLKFDDKQRISREGGVPPVLGRRKNPPMFAYHQGKMYDFQGNEVYETDSNECILETQSRITSACSLDDLFCLTEEGDIWDVRKKVVISHEPRAQSLSSYRGDLLYIDDNSISRVNDGAKIIHLREEGIDGKITKVLPIHGGWYDLFISTCTTKLTKNI